MPKQSAGILLYRLAELGPEVLLVHPGGPFWAKKDDGAWSIPKGLFEPGEEPLAAARREFAEETGHSLSGDFVALGAFRQPSGKTVVAYIREEDLRFLPGAMRDALPVISATPASLEGVLERLLTAPRETLAGMGARGRAYVERWHDPVRIADALRRDYEAIVGTPRRLTAAPSSR